jgi:putative transcriptional regulator
MVEVSRQTIVAIEAGDYAPSVYLALRLAAVLGDSVEALFATEPGSGTNPGGGDRYDD